MKNLKLIVTNRGFWLFLYVIAVTVALVWVSVLYHNHKCPEYDSTEIDKIILESNLKTQHLEKIINSDSVIIWKSDRATLDSMRPNRYLEYLYRDTLHR